MGLKGGAIETDEEEFPEITYSNISDEYDVNFPRHLIIKSDSFLKIQDQHLTPLMVCDVRNL